MIVSPRFEQLGQRHRSWPRGRVPAGTMTHTARGAVELRRQRPSRSAAPRRALGASGLDGVGVAVVGDDLVAVLDAAAASCCRPCGPDRPWRSSSRPPNSPKARRPRRATPGGRGRRGSDGRRWTARRSSVPKSYPIAGDRHVGRWARAARAARRRPMFGTALVELAGGVQEPRAVAGGDGDAVESVADGAAGARAGRPGRTAGTPVRTRSRPGVTLLLQPVELVAVGRRRLDRRAAAGARARARCSASTR